MPEIAQTPETSPKSQGNRWGGKFAAALLVSVPTAVAGIGTAELAEALNAPTPVQVAATMPVAAAFGVQAFAIGLVVVAVARTVRPSSIRRGGREFGQDARTLARGIGAGARWLWMRRGMGAVGARRAWDHRGALIPRHRPFRGWTRETWGGFVITWSSIACLPLADAYGGGSLPVLTAMGVAFLIAMLMGYSVGAHRDFAKAVRWCWTVDRTDAEKE